MGERVQAAVAVRSAAVDPRIAPPPVKIVGANSACPELDCVRDRLSAVVLAEAQRRAERLGTGADRVLIANGGVDEEGYVRALAFSLGLAFETLDTTPRAACRLGDNRLIEGAAMGVITLASDDDDVFVIAPRHLTARTLATFARRHPDLARRFRLTTTERLDRFALRCARQTLVGQAATGLGERWPAMSAAPTRRPWQIRLRTLLTATAIAAVGSAPAETLLAIEALLAAFFLAWLALRLMAAVTPPPRSARRPIRRDADLPVYTVIAALYREARSIDGLLRALARFDYPPEKLDIILAIEEDDHETREAIAAHCGALPVRVVVVPEGVPRTKPRALNAALPFARGHYVVVYDAEDRPEPDQLRCAVDAFAAGDGRLACVQARLAIDNTDDGWLAQLFTAEYAAQFEVFLDGLAAFRLPLPLGGSSNHFAADVLRKVGGWDAWNVTEDADLGMRLARFGYRTATLVSTTYEEAPARLTPWLRQRTRWFKGWMQTWCVHMRDPRRLWRELKPRGFLTFQLVVGGNVLAALVHPLCIVTLAVAAIGGGLPSLTATPAATALTLLYTLSLLAGYAASALLGYIGLTRQGLTRCAQVLWLTPLHWVLLSCAAWRALYQFAVAPYAWEKTEHGLAKHSRRAERRARSLAALEQEIAAMQAVQIEGASDRRAAAAPPQRRAQR